MAGAIFDDDVDAEQVETKTVLDLFGQRPQLTEVGRNQRIDKIRISYLRPN